MNKIVSRFIFTACLGAGVASLPGQVSRDQQAALTPQAALDRLVAGHARFLAGRPESRDLPAAVAASAAGQFPAAVVITCLDSRTSAELLFDQGLGDVFCGRIAGNFIDDEMLGSIEFATRVAGAPLIVVLGHSGCGAIKGACDNVKLGHLTATLAPIQPAVAAVPAEVTPRNSTNARFVQLVTAENVRRAVARIRQEGDVLPPLLAAGEVGVIGGIYDLATGRIEWLPDTAANVTVAAQ